MQALSRRQDQISGLISCGMAKKEIADILHISESTVDNTLRVVYAKTGLGKTNELTGWWISKRYGLSIDFTELKKQIVAMSFLFLICLSAANNCNAIVRVRRNRKENETEQWNQFKISL